MYYLAEEALIIFDSMPVLISRPAQSRVLKISRTGVRTNKHTRLPRLGTVGGDT